ncbi:MAG: 2Fe-2S iron-sulfur cluster binding domain-containing protein [Candidatus Riflebacteria bacterium]|nr:2Fe-2S iron-sulfur cluster binding domain-containing protein [Candidatus Riflebacteria bacterium]
MLTTMVYALLAMNGLVLALCLLLLVSRRWLGSFGPRTIRLEGGREITVQGGSSLILSLYAGKVFVPSACGGRGTCGYCKVKVREGGGSVLPTEQLVLTPAEIRDGVRLACQVRVRRDLTVEVPAEFLAVQEYQTVVEHVEALTDLIRKITFRLVEPATMAFRPGQYVQLSLTRPGEDPVCRGYSVASSPHETGRIELHIRRVENGIMSTYLHSLQVGDRLTMSGPYGEFYLREDTDRAVVCIAGGVGLAPLNSIIRSLAAAGSERPVWLFYGARTLPLLYYHQEFVEAARRNPRFRYVPALSEDAGDGGWTGHRGFITRVFEEVFPAGEPAEAYLCGPPIMIDALLPIVEAKGIRREDIFYDRF